MAIKYIMIMQQYIITTSKHCICQYESCILRENTCILALSWMQLAQNNPSLEIKIHEHCPPKSIIKPCGALQGTGSIRSMSMHTMTRWQGYISVEKVQLHGRDTHAYNNIIHIVF